MEDKLRIDLACGQTKKKGWFGIDIADVSGVDLVHDLTKYPWPVEDETADEVHCSHYIEHIPHDNWEDILKDCNSFEEFKVKALEPKKDGLIKFMDELYRIMKPGAKATITAPHYMNVRAYGDPTHRRYIGDLSFPYFNKEWLTVNGLDHYGITADFDIRFSYYIDNEMTLKSEETRSKAFRNDWNAITDIIIELEKRVV